MMQQQMNQHNQRCLSLDLVWFQQGWMYEVKGLTYLQPVLPEDKHLPLTAFAEGDTVLWIGSECYDVDF